MSIQTKNFRPDIDAKLLCTCGHKDCDKRSAGQEILNILQLIRDDANRPLIITSGGRCPNHKNEVKRSKPADHQLCVALDVACSGGIERGQLVKLAIKHGANAIGIASNFVHIGKRSEINDSDLMVWVY